MRTLWSLLTPLLCLVLLAPAAQSSNSDHDLLKQQVQQQQERIDRLMELVRLMREARENMDRFNQNRPTGGGGVTPTGGGTSQPGGGSDQRQPLNPNIPEEDILIDLDHMIEEFEETAKEHDPKKPSNKDKDPGIAVTDLVREVSSKGLGKQTKSQATGERMQKLLKKGWQLDDRKTKTRLQDMEKAPKALYLKETLKGILIGLLEEARTLKAPKDVTGPLEKALKLAQEPWPGE